MNPWQSLRREIDGAIRSIRYDLSSKQSKRATRRDPILVPHTGHRSTKDRRILYAAAAAVLLPVAGVSGYLAVTSGLNALFPGESAPNGLPATSPGLKALSPSPDAPIQPVAGAEPARERPAPRISPSFTAPVPTPAPTCQCTPPPPPPTPTPSSSPSMAPSTTPTMTPMPTPAATQSTWHAGSPSPRSTSRLRP